MGKIGFHFLCKMVFTGYKKKALANTLSATDFTRPRHFTPAAASSAQLDSNGERKRLLFGFVRSKQPIWA
ncbi:hypothetical protein [Ligaoa zhengdingensis]|uniref:hypothetical protein n=1 Tax=Ligaoa zhengdingensis TaxID=2763658 RepID=UPI0031B9C98B